MLTSRVEGPKTPASVLVVDDKRGPRASIRLVLEPRFRVTTAESGEQALDLLRRQQVDVVMLDLMMPGLGDIETFRRIRAMDSDLQIIIVSGGSLDNLAHALPHTASAWIPKPVEARTLVEAVERAAEETRCRRLRATESRAFTPREIRAAAPEAGEERQHDVAQMISHDIKNRLNAILLFTRVLRQSQLGGSHTEKALDVIESNVHEAATLTLNFLHAEQSDGGALQLHKTPAFLNQIVERVMNDETPRARLRRIDLQADLDSALPPVDLDIAMISRSVANLLINALHYSPEGSVVRVETRRLSDVMILRVRDHGPGIPAEEVSRLFERYGRGAKSASSTSTGLGLYLVRTIAEAHGGSVSATFPPDGGSAFVIVLPLKPDIPSESSSGTTGRGARPCSPSHISRNSSRRTRRPRSDTPGL